MPRHDSSTQRARSTDATLPWEARPSAELLRLSWPIAISTLSYSVMTLVDTLFVGRLGPAALAGVGLGGHAAFTLVCFALGLLRGVKVLVSQAVGAGRRHEARDHVATGLAAALLLGVLAAVLGQGMAELLPRIAATEASGRAAADYHAVRMLGSPVFLAYVALREVRYGLGDSRSPMIATLLGNGTNVALDALFILGLDWGVTGAAWATLAGHAVEAVVLTGGLRASSLGAVRLGSLRALMRVGVPTGLQFFIEVGSFALLAALLAALGETEMAAHQVALQVVHFAFLPCHAVAEAASVLAGQAMGAQRPKLVPALGRQALALTGAWGALSMVVLLAFGGPIARAFTDDPGLVAAVRALLVVAAAFVMADGANLTFRGLLRGAGDVRYPAVVTVTASWVFTPPLTYLLGYRMHLGALGGWLGLLLEIVVGAALLGWRLYRGGWRDAATRTLAANAADLDAA
ncbi:MAG: MATE family efflux transporter [Myxococcota bacterium]